MLARCIYEERAKEASSDEGHLHGVGRAVFEGLRRHDEEAAYSD